MICAAGAWSRHAGELAGVTLPVSPLRRQVLFTEPMPRPPEAHPADDRLQHDFYFHGEGPGLLMGMSDPTETPGFNLETTDDWIPALLEAAERRAPRVAAAGIRGGWAGLYDMSPDHNAIIGEAAGVSASSTPPGSPATASCRARRPARSCATSSSRRHRSSTSRR